MTDEVQQPVQPEATAPQEPVVPAEENAPVAPAVPAEQSHIPGEGEQAAPDAPLEPAQTAAAAEEVQPEVALEAPAAPSELNQCVPCGGEGLVKEGNKDILCSNCQGKGKVS